VPFENVSPGLWLLETFTVEQLSVAVGTVQVTDVSHDDEFVVAVISDGHAETTGSVSSFTTTLKVHVDVFPDPSVNV
jgi:hypothetical protein